MVFCCFNDIFEKLLVLLLGTKSPSFPSLKKTQTTTTKAPILGISTGINSDNLQGTVILVQWQYDQG